MEYYNNQLCVQADWLINEAGILTETNYKALVRRDQIKVLRRGCLNTPALVAYDSIPERFRMIMEAGYGDLRKGITRNLLVERIEHDAKATDYYAAYMLPNRHHLPEKVQREYYTNAILLNACNRLINERKAYRKTRGKMTTPHIWEEMARHIEDLASATYPHTLPANARRLEGRFKTYMTDGYECLIHRNFCNKSAAKVNDDIKESLLTELIGDPRNLDNEQVRSLYNIIAEKMGWKQITASAVAVWRDKLEVVTHPGRRGGNDFMNNKAMQVKRSRPTSPLFFWTMDGWDAELLYQKMENGRTTYHNRLTVVVVLDPCINYPIGFAVGTHETPELITAALRNAVNHTAELWGDRYRTHQLQSDHYAIKALTPLYEGMAEKVTPARVKNAKTKVIEPYFHYINKKYCQLMPNWSGFGVTSKKDNQPNVDFLNQYRHSFPDQEGVVKQIEGIMTLERNEKRTKYMELWSNTPEAEKLPLSWSQYLYYFGAETGFKNMLQGPGLLMSIDGIKHSYDCYDLSFREHAAVRWAVKYDPTDTSKVLAINEDGTLRYELEEKYVQPMALQDRKEGDFAQLERVKTFNNVLVESITEQRKVTATAIGTMFEENPQLNETLTKLILVDSKGQHKDTRSAGRLGVGSKAVGSKAVGSKGVGSKGVGSKGVGSKAVGSKAVGSKENDEEEDDVNFYKMV